jgi:hypothetical protein
MTKHTPGPWVVQESNAGETVIEHKALIQAQPGSPFAAVHADTFDSDETVDANARLIAAAPELLAALEAIVDECGGPQRKVHALPERLLKNAIRAVLKAKGENNE